MLEHTGHFSQRYRMKMAWFTHLLDALADAITVDYSRSRLSIGSNDPIYPEIVLAIGLRFVGQGSTVADLADVYGSSQKYNYRSISPSYLLRFK